MAPDESAGPTLAEAAIVYGATVGPSVVAAMVWGIESRDAVAFTNEHLYGIVLWEIVLAGLLVPWLWTRGWKPWVAAGSPEPVDVLRGGGVWLLATGCVWTAWATFALLQPTLAAALAAEQRYTGIPAAAPAIVLVSVLNPVFEEFLWLGYGVQRLGERFGLRAAMATSIVLRTAVHAYQGPWAVLGILPLAVALTWYYGRTRRLWPVVVAHVLFDAIGLAARIAGSR